MCRQMKCIKLKEDWTVILELLQQHKERTAALLESKKASKTFFCCFPKNYVPVINRVIGILYERRIAF